MLYNISELTLNQSHTPTICEINQFEMLNQVTKTPIIAYWFLIAIFTILLLYIFIPKIKEYISAEQIIYPIFMLNITAIFFYSLTTFNITQELYKKVLEPILYIICTIGIIYIIVRERKKIKEIINRMRET